jgi:hypothetical protein
LFLSVIFGLDPEIQKFFKFGRDNRILQDFVNIDESKKVSRLSCNPVKGFDITTILDRRLKMKKYFYVLPFATYFIMACYCGLNAETGASLADALNNSVNKKAKTVTNTETKAAAPAVAPAEPVKKEPEAAPVAAEPEKAEPTKAEASKETVEIKFGTAVENRELTGQAESFPETTEKVYCWTKVSGLEVPANIKHVWYNKGTKISENSLAINYPTTRTWSYKSITPETSGDWSVEVVDSNGAVLKKGSFKVGQ